MPLEPNLVYFLGQIESGMFGLKGRWRKILRKTLYFAGSKKPYFSTKQDMQSNNCGYSFHAEIDLVLLLLLMPALK